MRQPRPQRVRPAIYPSGSRHLAQTGPLVLRPKADLANEVMDALFGAPKRVRMGPFPWTKKKGRNMDEVVGSVKEIVPAPPGWSVLYALEDDDKVAWEETLVGWAIVVIWVTPEAKEGEPEPTRREYQTEVQPYTVSPEGIGDVPCMREGIVQLALLQPGQSRIARQPE